MQVGSEGRWLADYLMTIIVLNKENKSYQFLFNGLFDLHFKKYYSKTTSLICISFSISSTCSNNFLYLGM